MPSGRHLAVIMFTDIAGYTAIMGRDEQRAFRLLSLNRDIQKPIIEARDGKWIKEIGDGILSSFKTVTDAVSAAIDIQEAVKDKEELKLRIGIHLGEVVFENEDVFGDGVNIAARIQAIAPPGQIFISEVVHHNISNKKDFRTRFIKEESLKNVKDPVRIYQVLTEGTPALKRRITPPNKRIVLLSFLLVLVAASLFFLFRNYSRSAANGIGKFNERSIAILPFEDISANKDQQYLADGLAEEISNSMTSISELKVIGPGSSKKYSAANEASQAIGDKLNVNIVLDGKIQRAGNSLRITAQLIRVSDGSIIWSQKFDKEMKDIFAIQDSIARHIVEQLRITLSDSEKPRLIKKQTNEEVYALYLKGLHTYKESSFEESMDYNRQAIKIDSGFAPSYAYLALARVWIINSTRRYTDPDGIREARDYATRAIQLDPSLAEGYSALALLAWTVELDFPVAKANFEKSVQLNPSASLILNRYGYFLLWMGEFDKAISMAEKAISSDPTDYNGYLVAAWGYGYKKRFREARKYGAEGKKLFPESKGFKKIDTWIDFQQKNYKDIIRDLSSDIVANPESLTESQLAFLAVAYHYTGDENKSRSVLQQLNQRKRKPNTSIDYNLAIIYMHQGLKDSVFACLQRSLANWEEDMKLIKIDPNWDPLHQDERYKSLYHLYGFDRYK